MNAVFYICPSDCQRVAALLSALKKHARTADGSDNRMSNLGKVTHHERDGSITVTDAGAPGVAGVAAAVERSVEWHFIVDAAAALQTDGSRVAVRVGGRNLGLLKWR